jgi:cytochrome b subunit of formate dehydrogenase
VKLSEKYGMASKMVVSFLDSYHGLKTKAGDLSVANCASCHGFHRVLPSTDSTSTIHSANLQKTCGECHPGISGKLAATPIHGIGGEGLQTKPAEMVEKIYIWAIIVIVGLMALHWLLDLFQHIRLLLKKSDTRRMRLGDVCQHTLLMTSFIVLVVTGFSLRFSESWISRLFFGFEGGFELRGTVHRIAAVLLISTVIWHLCFLFTKRGKQFIKDIFPQFIKDIFPSFTDLKDFSLRIGFYLGRTKATPLFGRFSYVEKVEYWALTCGIAVMISSGILLWFDNYFIQFLPIGVMDVTLVVHYYEAILASLSILIWHLYATVFNPQVYPMNPSWLTGKMPREMIENTHPGEKVE